MTYLRVLFLSLMLALTAPLAALADDAAAKPTVLINLTSDDVWTDQMALGLARTLQEDGVDVVVFLNVRAVALANRNVPQPVEAMSGKTAHQMLTEIIAAGGRVFVCPGCTKQAGLNIEDRIEGIEPGGPAFRAILTAPGTRIMSY